MKKRIILSTVLGLLALAASAVAFTTFQICFVQSFWLHAMVAPLNPQSIVQPTSLTHIGETCQVLCPAFLFVGASLFLRAGWLLCYLGIRRRQESGK